MSDTLPKTDDVLATILQKALDVATSTGDFIAGQIPDVAKQLLLFEASWALVWMVLAIVIAVFAIWPYKCAKKMVADDSDWGPMYLIPSVLWLVSVVVFMANIYDFLKITLAPKLYLLEYVAHLVNGRH